MRKFLTGLLAGVLAFGAVGAAEVQAATREEIAAIEVVHAADFKYWNEGSPTLEKIINFVEEATDPTSPNYIPPEDRIATFDMDGTFYCETAPLYFQETMFLHRALDDTSYTPDRKMRSFAQKIRPKIYDKTGLTAAETKTLIGYLTKAYEGMTPDEYRAYVRNFMNDPEIGLTNLTRGEAFYLPMVEIISYLTNNDFAVYIDSACGVDTMRELVGDILPIRSDRIIGTDFGYTTTNMGKDAPGSHFFDRHREKVVIAGTYLHDNAKSVKIFSILNHIGRKPVLAFGNSMGDSGMLEYTLQDNKYRSLSFFVLCDDTTRELGDTLKADKLKGEAIRRGWDTISMRDEFKTIYGDNVKKS